MSSSPVCRSSIFRCNYLGLFCQHRAVRLNSLLMWLPWDTIDLRLCVCSCKKSSVGNQDIIWIVGIKDRNFSQIFSKPDGVRNLQNGAFRQTNCTLGQWHKKGSRQTRGSRVIQGNCTFASFWKGLWQTSSVLDDFAWEAFCRNRAVFGTFTFTSIQKVLFVRPEVLG